MDKDTKHTFGCSSPRIDGDADKRHLMVSMGTHMHVPLLHHVQAQTIWLLSFDTLVMISKGWGAHPRYLDDVQHTRGETSQQWH